MTHSPSDLKTSSKAALNLVSRSRSRKWQLPGQVPCLLGHPGAGRLAPRAGQKEVGDFARRTCRGRPSVSEECWELIRQLASENAPPGYLRLKGELRKLGFEVSASTIRRVLRRHCIPPAPRRSALTWSGFLAAHASTIVATDFFSVDTVFFKRLYVLFLVHLESHHILLTACTESPDSGWATEQARNLTLD